MTRATRGFTLIETLVALAVLSVGLLGAAVMLLDSLRGHAGSLQEVAAASLVRDMSDRIRVNSLGGEHYASSSSPAVTPVCDDSHGCDAAQLAAADLAHFAAAAHALFPNADIAAHVDFAPATGPAAPARYLIRLRWTQARNVAGTQSVAMQVLAQSPVAG